MCDCARAAINKGYIIQGGAYDELKHDFADTDDYCMPLSVRDDKGRFQNHKVRIRCCPICGEKLIK